MSKGPLTSARLVKGGFKRIGCWELNSSNDLVHSANLPLEPGVYAFAIDGTVRYVGLASRSLRQRFNFYRRPGATQRTSIRLNELIRDQLQYGTVVEILVAHPPDHQWNAFTVKGAEGLEAGLIADFELPWNLRGTAPTFGRRLVPEDGRVVPKKSLSGQILELVKRRPGMTELEIAKELFGGTAVQQNVNADCRLLVTLGLVERKGVGGRGDPYTYRPLTK